MPLITHRFPLSRIGEAYRLFESRQDGAFYCKRGYKFVPPFAVKCSVLPAFEKAVCLPDPAQWKAVRNERHGVDLALSDRAQSQPSMPPIQKVRFLPYISAKSSVCGRS